MTRTEEILEQLNVTRRYTGRPYAATGIELVIEDEGLLRDVTKRLYPQLGEQYHDTWRNIQRNLRTVVDVAYRTNRAYLEYLAHRTLDTCPTPADFIDIIASHLMRIKDPAGSAR